ncbi:MAG: outer membrane beta-barrel protein, partial [Bacteroidota bacterium]
QPVVDNSNPLQVYVGNPDLKAAYAHSLRLRYMAFSQFTFSSFFATLNATYTSNSITNTVAIDSQLVQLTQPVNVDRDINVNTYVAYSTPIRPLKVKINVRPSLVYNRSILFVNAVENNSDRLVSSVNFSVDNRKKEDIDIRVGAKFSHNLTNYSENTDLNQTFFTSNYYTDLVFNLSDRWTLSSTFDYTVYTGQAFADNEAIPVWQGSVSRFLFNDKRGELKLSVFDILDQNQGFSRNSTFNYIEEQRSNALGRYYLVSFTYAMRGFKKPSGGWWSRFGDSRR